MSFVVQSRVRKRMSKVMYLSYCSILAKMVEQSESGNL